MRRLPSAFKFCPKAQLFTQFTNTLQVLPPSCRCLRFGLIVDIVRLIKYVGTNSARNVHAPQFLAGDAKVYFCFPTGA